MSIMLVRCLVVIAAGTIAGSPLPASADSTSQGAMIIEAAARAMGGAESIRGLGSVRRDGRDHWVDTLQQRRPWTGPIVVDKLPVGEHIGVTLFVDYRTATFVKIQRFDDRPEERFTQIDGGTPNGGVFKGRFQEEPSFYSTTPPEAAARARAAEIKRLPEGLVRFALEHPDRVRFVGKRVDGRMVYDVVAITDPELGENLLYVDRATHLPRKAEFTRDHPIYGDATVETLFQDYRTTGRLKLPHQVTYRVGRRPTHIYRFSRITLDVAAPADALAAPAQYVTAIADPETPQLRDLGGGVYAVRGPYNVMFAVFDDKVVLSEAPLSEGFVLQCLDLIAKVAPGKPIIAVASHFHADHIGGVRALIARGIPIVARPETIDFIRRAAAAHKTVNRDLLSAHPRNPRFISMARRMTFSDAHQRVEVIDVTPGQHSEHMLAVYFRDARTIHVADLWDVPAPEQAIAGNDGERLWNTIRSLKLDVERMVPVHGNPVTRAQMERGLAIRAKYLHAQEGQR